MHAHFSALGGAGRISSGINGFSVRYIFKKWYRLDSFNYVPDYMLISLILVMYTTYYIYVYHFFPFCKMPMRASILKTTLV